MDRQKFVNKGVRQAGDKPFPEMNHCYLHSGEHALEARIKCHTVHLKCIRNIVRKISAIFQAPIMLD